MLVVRLYVLCVQVGGLLMTIAHAGDAANVFNSMEDDCRSPAGCLKSLKTPAVPLGRLSVSCSPSVMLVRVKADLFNLGDPVNPHFLTLGGHCGVTEASSEEFIIHAALTDCGTLYRLTDDSLVYTNVLVYDPRPSLHGVIRQERMSVPLQCVYSRRVRVDMVSVVPTWLSHLSSHTAEHALHFTFRLMASDLQVMEKGVYLLGDVMNMEVSVFAPLLDLWVFVQDCVATRTRDAQSVPRYEFIKNGCFVDGLQTSSVSRFLPRTQHNKLQLQLHTYIFKQVHSKQIFISCSLKADQPSSSSSRACSYIHGSWRSTDGAHSMCESCQTSDETEQNPQAAPVHVKLGTLALGNSASTWRNPEQTDSHMLKQVQVGPLSLSRWSEIVPPKVLEGVNLIHGPSYKSKRLTAQGNTSTLVLDLFGFEEEASLQSSISAVTEDVVSVTPTAELHLTVSPLMTTTLKPITSLPKTQPIVAVLKSTEAWSTALNSTPGGEEDEEDYTSSHTGFDGAMM